MEISASERTKLEKFQMQAKKVLNSRFIQTGFGPSLKMSFDDKGLSIQSTEVDEEQLKAVLVDLRPLISGAESIDLNKICDLIEVISPKPEILNMEREIRASRKRELKKGFIQMQLDGQDFNDEKMFNLISNSKYFHLNDEKNATFEKLDEHGKKLGRHQFLSNIYIQIVAIRNLHNCVGLLLAEVEDSG